jgi:hypothetical protein
MNEQLGALAQSVTAARTQPRTTQGSDGGQVPKYLGWSVAFAQDRRLILILLKVSGDPGPRKPLRLVGWPRAAIKGQNPSFA